MREAINYEKLSDSRVRCNTCQWRCLINPGKVGVCHMYENTDGTLYSLNYGMVSALNADPIEKKPLFHFYPGTLVYSLGGWGCNFHCRGCQNWEIAMADIPSASVVPSPLEAVENAKKSGCRGIAWTYNEPTVWYEYTLDCAKEAKKNGLYTVYVTNGYMTTEALDTLAPYLDAWRVDVKGFNDNYYRSMIEIPHWQGILEVAERAKNKWGKHVEVVTNIIPSLNDDKVQLKSIAEWIAGSLGTDTPWHVTRFHPAFEAGDYPATPLLKLEEAHATGKAAGLKYVYIGNVPGSIGENTVCPNCGKTVVERFGYETDISGLENGNCRYCGKHLEFHPDSIGGGE